jgi:hypothetical protein
MSTQNDISGTKRVSVSAIRQGNAEIQTSAGMAVWKYISMVVLKYCRVTSLKHRNPDLLQQCNQPLNQQENNDLYLYILNYSL